MKTRWFVLILVAVMLVTVPAAAKQKVPVGEKINVLVGSPDTFPAGEPFHISHGWALDPTLGHAVGLFGFELEVDGVLREEDFVDRWTDPDVSEPLVRKWVHNFPGGMTGVHTFTGHWLAPCKAAVYYGHLPGPCPRPNEVVEAIEQSLTVTFTP
jgi:hypothetical protein